MVQSPDEYKTFVVIAIFKSVVYFSCAAIIFSYLWLMEETFSPRKLDEWLKFLPFKYFEGSLCVSSW